MVQRNLPLFSVLLVAFVLIGCRPSPSPIGSGDCDLTDIEYKMEPYAIIKPDSFPPIPIPLDNPQTKAGVALGRMLFYDPILSADSSMSCAGCHFPQFSFSDAKAVSIGIDGIAGRRSSMSLLNVAYVTSGLFWDGRSKTLEEQALLPVEDPIELHNTWPNALEKIRKTERYQEAFRKAFGISTCDDITKELAAKAIAQFERILISSGKSKFDYFNENKDPDRLTEAEFEGFLLFNDQGGPIGLPDAECFHCHSNILFTSNEFNNNGLDAVAQLEDFQDKGLGAVTGNRAKNGMFRIPGLRNIALTAPFMHDGRFETLEEVIEHYSSGGHPSPNRDALIRPLGFPPNAQGLTPKQKNALLQFLHTLTDTTFVKNPDILNPFE